MRDLYRRLGRRLGERFVVDELWWAVFGEDFCMAVSGSGSG